MCSGLQGDETSRYLSKCLFYRFRRRRHFLFQNDFSCFIQNTVERTAISQIHTDRPIVSFCSLKISLPNTCTVLIFFIAGLLLCLEHVEHWERIASRWRPAFSSHLVSSIKVEVNKKHLSNGWPFPCFAAHLIE